jgi:hypothetical protein
MSDTTQSFESHAKMVPLYHYAAFGLIFVPTVYSLVTTVTNFSVGSLMGAAFGIGVILLFFYARAFPLGVQDRVIRLEEQLRMERVLPDDLKGRIGEISTSHLIGLRFAPDAELADLTRQVLDGTLQDRKSIKQAIGSWKADNQRI